MIINCLFDRFYSMKPKLSVLFLVRSHRTIHSVLRHHFKLFWTSHLARYCIMNICSSKKTNVFEKLPIRERLKFSRHIFLSFDSKCCVVKQYRLGACYSKCLTRRARFSIWFESSIFSIQYHFGDVIVELKIINWSVLFIDQVLSCFLSMLCHIVAFIILLYSDPGISAWYQYHHCDTNGFYQSAVKTINSIVHL